MRYELTILLLGSYQPIELSKDEFEAIKSAQNCMFVALGIEERLNLLMDNYAEFEQEMFNQSLRYTLFHDSNWASFTTDLHTMNRRFANLLTASRLYVDQVKHELSSLFGKESKEFTEFSQSCSHEYDTHLGYRVMEELRNIMQHQGLPIQQLERTSERVERGESYLLKSSSTLSVNMSHLKETAQIKSRILKELEQVQIKGGVNIKPLVREYISCINRLHKSTRVMLVPHFQKWNATFEKAILALHAKFGKDITGGGVIARDENGKGVESLYLVDDIKKKFDVLQQRNSCIARHEIQYISTE